MAADQRLANALGRYRREVKHLNQIYEWRIAGAWIQHGFAWAHWRNLARYPWEPAIGPTLPMEEQL